MKFQSTINLLVSHYDPAITDVETPNHSSAILNYEIEIGRQSPNGHYVKISYDGKFKGLIELSNGVNVDLNGYTIENLESIGEIQEGEYPEWALDITNKKIVLL